MVTIAVEAAEKAMEVLARCCVALVMAGYGSVGAEALLATGEAIAVAEPPGTTTTAGRVQ